MLGDVAHVEVHLDGTSALVDTADVPLIAGEKWHFSDSGVRRVRTPQVGLHRVILGLSPGDARRVDHENGNPLDNRRQNLRPADAAENGWNRIRPNRNNTSGVPGVSKNGSGWMAYVNVRGRRVYLGTFPTIEEAATARRAAELTHFGEWAPHHPVTNQKSPRRGAAGANGPIV